MQSITFKVPYENIEKSLENFKRQDKFIEAYGFEAWLQRVGLSHLIPTYRKNQGLTGLPKKTTSPK